MGINRNQPSLYRTSISLQCFHIQISLFKFIKRDLKKGLFFIEMHVWVSGRSRRSAKPIIIVGSNPTTCSSINTKTNVYYTYHFSKRRDTRIKKLSYHHGLNHYCYYM